jgi:hypothetical protein
LATLTERTAAAVPGCRQDPSANSGSELALTFTKNWDGPRPLSTPYFRANPSILAFWKVATIKNGRTPSSERRTNFSPPNMLPKLSSIVAPVAFDRAVGASSLNLAGYGLLGMFVLSIVELAATAVPMNPAWEFQAGGHITDVSWALLLGMALLFRRDAGQNFPTIEFRLMRGLSRMCLFFAFAYILLGVIIWNAEWRIGELDRNQTQQAGEKLDKQVQAMVSAAAQAKTVEDLQTLSSQKAGAGQSVEAFQAQLTGQVRQQLKGQRAQLETDLTSRAESRFWLKVRISGQSLIIAILCLFMLFRTHDLRI